MEINYQLETWYSMMTEGSTKNFDVATIPGQVECTVLIKSQLEESLLQVCQGYMSFEYVVASNCKCLQPGCKVKQRLTSCAYCSLTRPAQTSLRRTQLMQHLRHHEFQLFLKARNEISSSVSA